MALPVELLAVRVRLTDSNFLCRLLRAAAGSFSVSVFDAFARTDARVPKWNFLVCFLLSFSVRSARDRGF